MAGVIVVVLGGVLAWLILAPSAAQRTSHDEVDAEMLEAAEDEVRDLGTHVSPEDADDELPDWGPGVPKRRDRAPPD